MTGVIERVEERCANCESELRGEFCSGCGQRARDLHQPVATMLAQAVEDVLNVDSRFLRTLLPLLLKPGEVTRSYLAGRRVAFVPPLRTYLVAAVVFFGVFAFLAEERPVHVVTAGSPEAEALDAARKRGESTDVSFELAAESRVFGEAYAAAVARAKSDPQAFGRAFYGNIPRTFFVLLPFFALLLELFYRRQGYYVEHLVFSLHYHAFVFAWFTLILLVDEGNDWMFGPLRIASGIAMAAWLMAYLPRALRRVYGGSWTKTLLKVAGLSVLYSIVTVIGFIGALFVALALL